MEQKEREVGIGPRKNEGLYLSINMRDTYVTSMKV